MISFNGARFGETNPNNKEAFKLASALKSVEFESSINAVTILEGAFDRTHAFADTLKLPNKMGVNAGTFRIEVGARAFRNTEFVTLDLSGPFTPFAVIGAEAFTSCGKLEAPDNPVGRPVPVGGEEAIAGAREAIARPQRAEGLRRWSPKESAAPGS
jgi:hypothetical protein